MLMFKTFVQLVRKKHILEIKHSELGEAQWHWTKGGEAWIALQEALTSVQLFVFDATSADFSKVIQAELTKVSAHDVKLPTNEEITDKKEKEKIVVESDVQLDVPFKSTWFEAVHPEYYTPVLGELGIETKNLQGRTKYEVVSQRGPMLVYEIAPKKYWVFEYSKKNGVEAILVFKGMEEPGEILQTYLNKLKTCTVAHEPVEEKIRIRDTSTSSKTKKRDYLNIKSIIRIIPKANIQSARPVVGKSIEWTHRWLVRGHWVTLWLDKHNGTVDYSRIGKDRSGEYCIKGFTWRREHEKGPDEAPLVSKTRIVK